MGVVVSTSRTKILSQQCPLFTHFAVFSIFYTSRSGISTKIDKLWSKSTWPIWENYCQVQHHFFGWVSDMQLFVKNHLVHRSKQFHSAVAQKQLRPMPTSRIWLLRKISTKIECMQSTNSLTGNFWMRFLLKYTLYLR